MFPSNENLATLKVFPDIESRNLEFKQSVDIPFTKLLPTICAFLNVGEGRIVFGVRDNQEIVGIRTNDKKFDMFLLLLDNILQTNMIVGTDGTQLKPDAITTECIPCWNGLSILVVYLRGDRVYQLKEGSIYYRLNASNMRMSGCPLYSESDVAGKLELTKRHMQEQYQEVLRRVEQQVVEQQRKLAALEQDNQETGQSRDACFIA